MNKIEFLYNKDKYQGIDSSKALSHYGILGQKWGQRRWQNADGTFNEAGKERYFGPSGTTKKNKEENKTNKRYNKKREELAHPDDPNDELTVKRLNEIKKQYQDQKIGKMTYGFDKNGKFFQINDKYQNPDGTLTKKGLKMLKKGKNIEDFADVELYEKSTMTPEEVTAYDEKKYWDPAKEISNNVQTTKELKGEDISDEEFNKILNDSISMYELRQDHSKRQEYNDVGDITLLAMRKAGWLDNDTFPGDDDSRFWALNEDQTIGFGALADLYYKGYSKDYIKKFIDKTESMSGEDFDEHPGAWEINYATYGDQGKKFVDALFSKEDNLDIDRFGSDQKIGSINSKEDAKANKEAVKLLADLNDKKYTKSYETLQKLYDDPRFEEQRNNVDKAIKEKFKDDFDDLEKTYGGFDKVENEYLALAGLNRALMEDGGKMEDISYMPRLYLYDDLNQGSLTGESIWAYDNGIEDSSERWSKIYNKENSTKDELVNSLTSDGSYNSKVLNGLDDGTKKDIVDHVYNYKSVPNSYWTLYNAGDTSKNEYDSVKDTTLKEAREISKKLSSSCGNDASGWALLNKAVNNLNLGSKDYTELTQADWDRINAEINSLKR